MLLLDRIPRSPQLRLPSYLSAVMELKLAGLFLVLTVIAVIQMVVLYVYFNDVSVVRGLDVEGVLWVLKHPPPPPALPSVNYQKHGTWREKAVHGKNFTRHAVYNISDGRLVIEILPDWTTQEPHDDVPTKRVYLYSALIALQDTPAEGSHVRLVTFVDRFVPPLSCCLTVGSSQSVTSEAKVYLLNHRQDPSSADRKTKQVVFFVMYQCKVPFQTTELGNSRVTLMPAGSGLCPRHPALYIPLETPEVVDGGMALCGKMAFGHLLKADRLVEWFELQRLMGVDKIQLFDLGNSEEVYRVARHYQDTGFLIFLPLKLPGFPWGRSMAKSTISQSGADAALSIMECRQRLAGYDYVISVDLDEVIMPMENITLKRFVQTHFSSDDTCSALYFMQRFFIEDWEPVDPNAPLHVLRYLNSTEPKMNRHKYIYRPDYTTYVRTHFAGTAGGFHISWVKPNLAFVHHYRKCPAEFKGCSDRQITEMSMTRFRETLVERVRDVLQKNRIQP